MKYKILLYRKQNLKSTNIFMWCEITNLHIVYQHFHFIIWCNLGTEKKRIPQHTCICAYYMYRSGRCLFFLLNIFCTLSAQKSSAFYFILTDCMFTSRWSISRGLLFSWAFLPPNAPLLSLKKHSIERHKMKLTEWW